MDELSSFQFLDLIGKLNCKQDTHRIYMVNYPFVRVRTGISRGFLLHPHIPYIFLQLFGEITRWSSRFTRSTRRTKKPPARRPPRRRKMEMVKNGPCRMTNSRFIMLDWVLLHFEMWTWLNMIENDWKWLNIIEHDWTYLKMIENFWKYLKMIEQYWTWLKIRLNWLNMIENDWTILNMIENDWTWLNNIEHDWKLDWTDWTWLKMIERANILGTNFIHFSDKLNVPRASYLRWSFFLIELTWTDMNWSINQIYQIYSLVIPFACRLWKWGTRPSTWIIQDSRIEQIHVTL